MSFAVYRGLTAAAAPLIRLYLARRLQAGKEDGARLGERLGAAGRARPAGPLVWIHGASVGESMSVLTLIERLLARRADLSVLVTTGTVTSARLLETRLPPRAFHQYVPADQPAWVRRFLDHWRPDLALWVESELWPNLILETRARGVPMALVNARMSGRSFARWRRMRPVVARLLQSFALCLAQSEGDAERLLALGARAPQAAGNLKFAAAPLPADDAELARLRAAIGARPVWVAASTHPGEEEIVAAAQRRILERRPDCLLVLAPRHAVRGDEIAAIIAGHGLALARRSQGAPVAADTAVYLADTMGELGLFYRLAGIALIGGSLVPHGGHNPLEAAQLDCAILHGPTMTNFAEITARLAEAGATIAVDDALALADAVLRLIETPGERDRLAAAAMQVAAANAGVLDHVMAALAPLLEGLNHRGTEALR